MTTTEAVVVERYALIHALRTAIRVYRKDAGGFCDIGDVKKASRFDAYADECAALADALAASVDVITVRDWVKD
jgi:hypothetical protein